MGRTAGQDPEHVRAITVVAPPHQVVLVRDAPHPEGVPADAPPGGVGTNALTNWRAGSRVGGQTLRRGCFFATFFGYE
mgnify:CR=1 FL=1